MKNTTAAVTGMEAKNLIDGKNYVVTSVIDGRICLEEILAETYQDKEPESLAIPEKKFLNVFQITKNPLEDEIPTGYTVSNGKLLKDGEPATEQGQLEFIGIMSCIAGEVIVAAKTKDKENGKMDVFAYNPFKDTFKKIVPCINSAEKIAEMSTGERFTFETTKVTPVIAVDVDGKDIEIDGKKVVLNDTVIELVSYSKNGGASWICLNGTVLDVKKVEGDKNLFAIETDKLLVPDKFGCNTRSLGEKDYKLVEYVNFNKIDEYTDVFEDSLNHILTVSLPNEKVTAATKSAATGDLVLRTENSLYIENHGHRARLITDNALKDISDYKYLISADIRNGSETYVLADDQYNVATITKTKTYDRGDIVKVEIQ